MQKASFKEYYRSDTRAIVYRETLYVKYASLLLKYIIHTSVSFHKFVRPPSKTVGHNFNLDSALLGTIDDIVLKRTGKCGKERTVSCNSYNKVLVLFGVLLRIKKSFL